MKAYSLITLTPALLLMLASCAPAQLKSTDPDTSATQRPIVRPITKPDVSDTKVQSDSKPESQPNPQSESRPAKPTARNPAVVALRAQADTALKKNEIPAATRLLERALRIDPRDAATYYAFAQLRIKQNQFQAATQLIDKAISLRPDANLTAQLESLREKATDQ